MEIVDEAWSPFYFGSDVDYDENETLMRSLLFQELILNMNNGVNGSEESDLKILGNMFLFQYLVRVLNIDFTPRNQVYEETINNLSLLNESSMNQLLVHPTNNGSETNGLRVFTFTELKKATKKFRPDTVVDVVGYYCSVRTFYKCYIDETTFALSRTETRIAASVLERNSLPYTLQVEDQVIKSIGQISHPNLVKVLGYCCKDKRSHFLVFEYYKGSLDRHIYGKKKEALPWEIRIKIAIGTARGLAFIHSTKNIPLYQELRMHNIMLDEQYNAKLFFLDSNEQCLEETQIIRTDDVYDQDSNSPECLCFNGKIVETDVFTFGVILLELLTGSKDTVKNERSKSSGVWTSLLSDDYKISEIIDPRLGNSYPVNAATQMGTLIRRCTKWDMNKRPSMQQVLDTLNYIAEIKD